MSSPSHLKQATDSGKVKRGKDFIRHIFENDEPKQVELQETGFLSRGLLFCVTARK